MKRRTLFATVLAGLVAPFAGAKPAPKLSLYDYFADRIEADFVRDWCRNQELYDAEQRALFERGWRKIWQTTPLVAVLLLSGCRLTYRTSPDPPPLPAWEVSDAQPTLFVYQVGAHECGE